MAFKYRNRRRERLDATYSRAYLITFGVVVLLVAAVALLLVRSAPQVAGAVAAGCGALGLALLGAGLFGSDTSVQRWADTASPHEATLVIVLLAWPLYWLMRRSKRR